MKILIDISFIIVLGFTFYKSTGWSIITFITTVLYMTYLARNNDMIKILLTWDAYDIKKRFRL